MADPENKGATGLPWPPLLWLAALLAGVWLGRLHPLAWPGVDDLPARAVGLIFGALGAGLVAWGAVTLYRANTTVLPHKPVARLVTDGAFRFRRNPIYMGEVLIFLGLAQVTGNIWFAVMAPVFAVAVLRLAILPEERHLEARFGKDYLEYKERTRRWF
jgi:protein-S-isoprenylcysteine O-methyltransferase Ste14